MNSIRKNDFVELKETFIDFIYHLPKEEAGKNETGYFKEYMAEAVAYIEEHLQEEDLSIITTAAHVYLNPVYFGRIFKSTFHMTFKQYLVKKRMDKAKRMPNITGISGNFNRILV